MALSSGGQTAERSKELFLLLCGVPGGKRSAVESHQLSSMAFNGAGSGWVDCLESMNPFLAGGVAAGAFGDVVFAPLSNLPPNHSFERTCPIARRGSLRSVKLVGHAAQLRIR